MSCFPLPNLKTAIAFLIKRVKQPNMDDYKNLTNCVRHRRELPVNHCDFDVIIVIYPFHWITRIILVTTVYLKSVYTYPIINVLYRRTIGYFFFITL